MNNIILIIDPAWRGKTGWLKWSKFYPSTAYGTLKAKEARNWQMRFDLFQGITTLVIENTYLKYIKAFAALEKAKMLWTQPAIDHFGLTEKDIIEVSPQSWQSGIQRGWKLGKDKDQNAIEFYVEQRFFSGKKTGLTEHELSCFGMLSFYLDNHVRPF